MLISNDHNLSIFKENFQGGWDYLYSVSTGTVPYYTFVGLEFNKKYRFEIATKCPDGTPSTLVSAIDGITLIIDLVLNGRSPINPVIIQGCPTINYQNHNWVGFKIEYIGSSSSIYNIFEFCDITSIPTIKRVNDSYSMITAANLDNVYPKLPMPSLVQVQGSLNFKVFRIKTPTSFVPIGHLAVNFDDVNHTIQICKDLSEPWNESFSFSMLTAESAIGFNTPEPPNNNLMNLHLEKKNNFSIQNPFNTELKLLLQERNINSPIMLKLLNLNGQTMLEQIFEISSSTVLINTVAIPAGIYFLHINIDQNIETYKVIKY